MRTERHKVERIEARYQKLCVERNLTSESYLQTAEATADAIKLADETLDAASQFSSSSHWSRSYRSTTSSLGNLSNNEDWQGEPDTSSSDAELWIIPSTDAGARLSPLSPHHPTPFQPSFDQHGDVTSRPINRGDPRPESVAGGMNENGRWTFNRPGTNERSLADSGLRSRACVKDENGHITWREPE